MDKIISIRNLIKTYGELTALDKITFDVKKGTMFGIVGPDGAGKTTLIRIMCGLLKADSGSVEIMGMKLSTNIGKIKNNIGYLSQKFSLYADLNVDENIDFIADIHGVKDFKKRKEELLKFTRLTNFRNFQAGNLSGGMKQKLALACTLIYRPQIIFLDEPTTGIDPVSRREFRIILANLLKEEITIIISTPYMDEAEHFNEIALVDKGKLLIVNSPDIIKSMIHETILEIVCFPIREAYKLLISENKYEVQMFGDRLNIIAKKEIDIENHVKDLFDKNDIKITGIRKISPSLENAYIYLIKESGKETEAA